MGLMSNIGSPRRTRPILARHPITHNRPTFPLESFLGLGISISIVIFTRVSSDAVSIGGDACVSCSEQIDSRTYEAGNPPEIASQPRDFPVNCGGFPDFRQLDAVGHAIR